MKRLLKFGGIVVHSLWRDLGYAEKGMGIFAVIAAIFLLVLPSQITCLAPFWARVIGVAIIILLILRGAYKAWDIADRERDRLQAEIDSEKSDVEFTDFDPEIQYRIMQGSRGKELVFRVAGRLRNKSPRNSGSLDFFRINIPVTTQTFHGSFIANSNNPQTGHKFEPNSIYPEKLYIFRGELLSPYIGSWEPHIKGAKGRINLQVQGQDIKTYPIKIAGKEGFE
jgi:hypothetical protein